MDVDFETGTRKMLCYRWYIYGILCIGYFLVYFHRVSSAVVAPELVEAFNLSAVSLGMISSMYFYPYALAQIPSGILADVWGPKKTVTVFVLLAALGAFLFGWAQNYAWAVLGRFLVGLGVAFIYIPTLKILAEWFRRREFATLTGILLAVGNMGALVASAPLGVLVSTVGWRNSFTIIGVVTLLLAAACWLIIWNRPQDKGLPSMQEIDRQEPVQEEVHVFGIGEALRRVFVNRNFWLLAAWYFVFYGTVMGFQGLWATPFLMDTQQMDKTLALGLLSCIAIGMVVGCPFGGYLSDRILHSHKKVLCLGTSLYTLAWAPIAFWPDWNWVALGVLFLFMGFFGGFFVVIYAWFKDLMPIQIVGTAVGALNFFPFAGGAVFQAWMGNAIAAYGQVGGRYSAEAYMEVFRICWMSLIVVSILVFFVKKSNEDKKAG